jgi:hypothetical protein
MHPSFKESTNADKFLKSIHITVEVSGVKLDKLLINLQQAVFLLYSGPGQICMNKTTIYK